MKQFTLKEYLKNPKHKVITRDGRPVRILCTDRNYDNYPIENNPIGSYGNYPIVALVQSHIREELCCYTEDGLFLYGTEDPNDLFFADEETHKHKGWMNIYKSFDSYCSAKGDFIFKTKQEAKEAINYNRDVYYITTVKIEWEE